MAFYFRKLGRTFRLVPATKSFGYSTYISEGDRKDDSTFFQRHAQIISGSHREATDSTLPPSSLVPLSVRDMSLVLLPRLEVLDNTRRHHPTDILEPIMRAAKTIPFTNDDILLESFYPPHFDRSLILERIIHDARHPSGDSNNSDELILGEKLVCQGSKPPDVEVRGRSMSNEECGQTDHIFDRLFMNCSGPQPPSLPSVSFCLSVEDTGDKSSKKTKNGPTSDQLQSMKEKLERSVTRMFTNKYDYSILHKDVILENNLFGDNVNKRGPTSYALELLKLRLKIHARFSSTSMEVLNTTVNEESGVIRIHWRLSGLPMIEMFKFWRVFQEREEISKDDYQWFEAFSYFHIGKDGLVHKHRIDRMLPGGNQENKLPLKLRKLLNRAKPLVT